MNITLVKGSRDSAGIAEYLVDGASFWAKDQIGALEQFHARQVEAIKRQHSIKTECAALISKAIASNGRIEIAPNFPAINVTSTAVELGWLARTHTRENRMWLFVAATEQGLDALKSAVDLETAGTPLASTPLRDAGEALYGPRWQSDLARDLNISDRTMRRWAAGTDMPPGVAIDLSRLCEERAQALDDVRDRLKAASAS